MSTTTTPRQPAQRAKGRAQIVFINTYAKGNPVFPKGHIAVHLTEMKARELRSVSRGSETAIASALIRLDQLDATVERMARAMWATAYGTNWLKAHPEDRKHAIYQAQVALKAIGIAAQKGRASK